MKTTVFGWLSPKERQAEHPLWVRGARCRLRSCLKLVCDEVTGFPVRDCGLAAQCTPCPALPPPAAPTGSEPRRSGRKLPLLCQAPPSRRAHLCVPPLQSLPGNSCCGGQVPVLPSFPSLRRPGKPHQCWPPTAHLLQADPHRGWDTPKGICRGDCCFPGRRVGLTPCAIIY